MSAFPFTGAEWSRVTEAALAVVNAGRVEDPVLRASHFEQLRFVLDELRARYGEHPILLETEADFTARAPQRVDLYRRAKEAAKARGLETYSICIALARVLLEDFGQPRAALVELRACEGELQACADASERQEWADLAQECAGLTR